MFASLPTNDLWRAQRKAVSHMFFKQRLNIMVEVLKEHLNVACDKWLAEIERNGGETRINIAEEFEIIFAHTINHICYGENFNGDLFDFYYYNPQEDRFIEKKVTMRVAVHNLTKQALKGFTKQMEHPITGPLNLLFGIRIEMGSYFRYMGENTKRVHA